MVTVPDDLYIPPDALHVHLNDFDGPFELLLYCIKKEKLDILSLSLSPLVDQYTSYLQTLDPKRYELAFVYLSMASFLIHLKSKILLPVHCASALPDEGEVDMGAADPAQQFLAQLRRYAMVQAQVIALEKQSRWMRDIFPARIHLPEPTTPYPLRYDTQIAQLVHAWKRCLQKQANKPKVHTVTPYHWSFTAQWDWTQRIVAQHLDKFADFWAFSPPHLGKTGCVWALLVLLEACKQAYVQLEQVHFAAPLRVFCKSKLQVSQHE